MYRHMRDELLKIAKERPFEPSARTKELEKWRDRAKTTRHIVTPIVGGLLGAGIGQLHGNAALGGAIGAGAGGALSLADNAISDWAQRRMQDKILSGQVDDQLQGSTLADMNRWTMRNLHGHEPLVFGGIGAGYGALGGASMGVPGVIGGAALGAGLGAIGGKHFEHQDALWKDLANHRLRQIGGEPIPEPE